MSNECIYIENYKIEENEQVWDLGEFKAQWVQALNKINKEPKGDEVFGLYIANPFCFSKCKFCIYNPTVTKIGSDLYKEYYQEYLPSVIKYFNDLFDIRVPDAIYFGGGTVNMMSHKILRDICGQINNFDKIPAKQLELNPILVNQQMLQAVVDLGFKYVSFGVQTFKQDVQEQYARKNPKLEKLGEYIEFLTNNGVFVNCDLLAFLRSGEVNDLKDLEEDITKLTQETKVCSITIYPMYQRFSGYIDSVYISNKLKRLKELKKVILKFHENTKFKQSMLEALSLDDSSVMEYGVFNYKLIKEDLIDYHWSKVNVYCSNGNREYMHDNFYTLGLGGYGKNIPYSYFGRGDFYRMRNIDNEDVLLTKVGPENSKGGCSGC